MAKRLFTSESVTEGHPDKICDQISDAVLDAILEKDPSGRVACETAVSTGLVHIMGEITTNCYVDIPKIARGVIRDMRAAIVNPTDYDARSNLMWASTMAEIGIIKLGKQCDFEAHMIEHQMGAYTDCNHGMGLGVIHPAYYRRICRDGIKKFVKFAVNVWGMSPDGGDEEELAFGGIDALQAFIHEIGLPGTLRELGITDQSLLKTIADSCIRNDGGYRQLTHAEILDILEECY